MNEHRMYPEGIGHDQSAKDAVIENYWGNNVRRSDGSFHPSQFMVRTADNPIIPLMTKKESVLKAMKRFKQMHPNPSIT